MYTHNNIWNFILQDFIDKEDVESLDQEASYSLRPRTQKVNIRTIAVRNDIYAIKKD